MSQLSNITVISSAPGKVILFGEHAVVHGVTAIAAALSDLRIFVNMATTDLTSNNRCVNIVFEDILVKDTNIATSVTVTFDEIRSLLPKNSDPNKYEKLDVERVNALHNFFAETQVPSVGQGLCAMVFLVANILPELIWSSVDDNAHLLNVGLTINVKSHGLPIGAGLGSSAAFSVALTGACYKVRQDLLAADGSQGVEFDSNGLVNPAPEALNIINDWAYGAEVLLHGTPSGLDNTTSCFGGFMRYSRKLSPQGQFETIAHAPRLNILLINTMQERKTSDLVAGVRNLLEKQETEVREKFDRIEAIAAKFLALTESDDRAADVFHTISKLFEDNHKLLCELGVGHPTLTTVVEESRKHGFSCKLTGAGGGGCAITLLPNELNSSDTASLKALKDNLFSNNGMPSFQSAVGGRGLQWHKHILNV